MKNQKQGDKKTFHDWEIIQIKHKIQTKYLQKINYFMILLILANLSLIKFDTIISIFDVRLRFWCKLLKYLMQKYKNYENKMVKIFTSLAQKNMKQPKINDFLRQMLEKSIRNHLRPVISVQINYNSPLQRMQRNQQRQRIAQQQRQKQINQQKRKQAEAQQLIFQEKRRIQAFRESQKQLAQSGQSNCVICLQKLSDQTISRIYQLSCGHCFHYTCITESFISNQIYNKKECPICRRDVKKQRK